ncbi:hypothetical protein RQP46_007084 [Phenoliferia psychrophenolica]
MVLPTTLVRATAYTGTHLRRRSSITEISQLSQPSPTGSDFSEATAYEDEEGPMYSPGQEKKGGYSAISIDDDPEGRGWKVASAIDKTPRRKVSQIIWTGGLLLAAAMGGWVVGSVRHTEPTRPVSHQSSRLPMDASERCNPYEQHGVLLVNTSVPNQNMWQPIGVPDSCQPVDYATQLLDMQLANGISHPTLESLRNRTVLIFGDSVDRDHNEHFCNFVGGFIEMIGNNHPLSPAYPEGQELPPEDYLDYIQNKRMWPDNPQSRPHICHVFRLNLRFVNVFHYGFRGYTHWMAMHPHYYPPASIEDRLDQIVIPLLANIAKQYNTSPVPDIVSIAPGFWGILRLSYETQRIRDAAIAAGNTTFLEGYAKHDVWNNMKEDQRDWMEGRIQEVIEYIGNGWRDSVKAPLILWRSLHHIQSHEQLPFTRVQALDQIGRSVVERLVREGEAAVKGAGEWKAWLALAASRVGRKWRGDSLEVTQAKGLSSRLRIDEWGALMLGQEKHFVDKVHPLPLPGSYLWANMMLFQLTTVAEDEL